MSELTPLETLASAWVGKLLQVSWVVERGSPKSNLWNPPLHSVLRMQWGEDVNRLNLESIGTWYVAQS